MFTVVYLFSAVIVAVLAIGQRGGFAVYFILAVALSPILALLILILPSPRAISRGNYDYVEYPADRSSSRRRSC